MQPDCGAADDGEEDGHAVVPWIPGCADEDDGHEWEAGAWSGFDEFDEWDDEWKDAGMEFARQLTEREDSDTLAEHPETPFDDDVDAAPQADVNHVVGPAAASCSMSFGKPQQTTRGGAAAASNVPSSSIDGRDGNTSASAARVDYPDTAEGGTPPRLAATEEAGARDDTQAERTPATLTPENAETIARATALAVAAAAAQPQGAAVGHPNAAGAAPQDGEGQAPVPQTTFRVKVWQDESKYIGEWVGDRMNGVGEMRWADGRRYLGEWLDNRCHGRGVLTYQDGRRYEGEYTADMMHGKGEYHWSEGARYVGEYREHKKHGRGVMTWKTGGRYDGDYVDDKMTGHGMMTWADGRRYEGEWLEGRCTGMGTTSFKSGSRYVGSYSCDKMEGRGCYTFADGRRYEGEYKSNQKHGRGVYKWGNGLLFSGTWAKGAPKQGVLLFRGGACARTVAARSDLCPDMALQKLQDEARAWVEKEMGGGSAKANGEAAAGAAQQSEDQSAGDEDVAAGGGAEGAGKKGAGWTVRRADAKADKGEGGADGSEKKEGGSWSLQGFLRSKWSKRAAGKGREEEEDKGGAAQRGSVRRGGWTGQWWKPRLVKEDDASAEDWLDLKEGELWHFFVGHEDEGGRHGNEGLGGVRLIEAADRGLLDVVMWFINASWAHVTFADANGRTALHAACRGRHYDVASFLLAMGADPGAMDAEGQRCLWCACASGNVALARLIAGACSEDDVIEATDDLFELAMLRGSVVGGTEASQMEAREGAREAVLEVWRRWSGSEGLVDALCSKQGIESALVGAARSQREDTRSAAECLVLSLGQRGRTCLALLTVAAQGLECEGEGAGRPISCIGELMEQTEKLELSGAETTEVAPSVGQLTNLTALSVTDSVIQVLPPQLADNSRLRTLRVKGGCLSALPEAIAALGELTTLDASSNVLVSLPASFAGMRHLSSIDLSRNRLQELAPGLGALHSLAFLSVEDNALGQWPKDLVQCSSLTQLEAGGNVGLGLPADAHRLVSLRVLSLAGNQLTSLAGGDPDGGAQPASDAVTLPEKSLRELNLAHNRLAVLPDTVVRCRSLECVWLSHNALSSLPAALADTRGLRTLHVDHNRIRLLPPSLSRTALMGTYDLKVEGNDMRHPMRLDSKLDCPVEELLGYCSALERGRERVMQATVVVDGPTKATTKLSVVDCFLATGGARKETGYGFQALKTWVGEKAKKDEVAGKMEAVVVEHSKLQQLVDGENVELQFLVASGSREGGHVVMREELLPGRSVLCFVWETRTPLIEVLASAKEALARFLQGQGKLRAGWSTNMSVMLVCVAGQQSSAVSGAPSQPAEVLRFFAEHADTSLLSPASRARHGRGAAAAAAFDLYCDRQKAASDATASAPDSGPKFAIRGFLTVDASLKHCAWVPMQGQQGGVRGVNPGEVLERLATMGRDAAVGDYAFPEAMAPQGLINAVEIISEMAQQRVERSGDGRSASKRMASGSSAGRGSSAGPAAAQSAKRRGGDEDGEARGERIVSLEVLRAVVEDQCGLAWQEYGAEVMTILQARGIAKVLGGPNDAPSHGDTPADASKVLLGAQWVGLAAGLVLGLGSMAQSQGWAAVVRTGREMLRGAGWAGAGALKKDAEKKIVEVCAQRLTAADPDGGMLCKGVLLEEVGTALFGSVAGAGAWGGGMPGFELVGSVLSSFGVLIREEVSRTFLVPSLCVNAIPYPLEWVRSTGAEGRREWIAWRRAEMVGEVRKYACFQVLARLAQKGEARLVLWRDGGLMTMQGGKLIVDGGVEVGALWFRGAGEDGVGERLVQVGVDTMRQLGLADDSQGQTAASEAEAEAEAEAELSFAAHQAALSLDDDGSSEDGSGGNAEAEALKAEAGADEREAGAAERAGEREAGAGEREAGAAAREREAGERAVLAAGQEEAGEAHGCAAPLKDDSADGPPAQARDSTQDRDAAQVREDETAAPERAGEGGKEGGEEGRDADACERERDEQLVGKEDGAAALLATGDGPTHIGPGPHPALEQASPA